MIGGVTVNFILGFVIYAFVLWTWGQEYIPTKNIQYGVQPDSLGMMLGIQRGDKVVALDTMELEQFNPAVVKTEIIIHGAKNLVVERNGQRVALPISEEMAKTLSAYENRGALLYQPLLPFIVHDFSKNSPAKESGIQKGDKIIALNGEPTPFFNDFFTALTTPRKPETLVTVTAVRTDANSQALDTLDFAITTNKDGLIGVVPVPPVLLFGSERIEYSLAEALPAGVKMGWKFLTDQVAAFGQMFTGKIAAKDSLGSFITIGSMFGNEWVWERFWKLTAALSLILGFINLLPIPALDGGHVMFLLWEVVTGRKPSDKFMEIATMIGFVILIAIMIYALGLDISRLF